MEKRQLIFLILIIMMLLAITTIMMTNNNSIAAMAHYQNVSFNSAVVTCNLLNLRLGPGLDFPVVSRLKYGEIVRVYAKIEKWYLVQSQENCVGMVHEDYLRSLTGTTSGGNTPPQQKAGDSGLSQEEKQLLDKINSARKKEGAPSLKVDAGLNKTASIKAEDMVKNDYFSHDSPTLGTPFEMLKQYNVGYRTAGENLAGNQSIQGAFDAWMKSEGHKKNILNENFNYTGIGIAESPKYGKILVQHFIGR